MAGKKRMSKRVSTRKREKINKKVRQHYKKQRKENKNKKRIPQSVLVTEEFKEHLEELKIATMKRTAEFYQDINKEI